MIMIITIITIIINKLCLACILLYHIKSIMRIISYSISGNLNFDTQESYTSTLSVSDGTHTIYIEIDIILIDINNGPPQFGQTFYSATILESASVGASVLTVTASDPDAASSPFGQLVYTFTENTENNFNIDPTNGKITVAGYLDAEKALVHNLVIQVKEVGGTNTATVTCMVNITDVNDNEPMCSKNSFSKTVPETSAVPADIETIDCRDDDVTGALQYTISTGDQSLFQMNNNVLQLIKEIDYDTSQNKMFDLTIDVSDGDNIIQVPGTVTVTAVNEDPPEFTQGNTLDVSRSMRFPTI